MLICVGSHICRGDIADTAIVETVSAETADTDVPEVSDAVSTDDAEIPSEDDVPDEDMLTDEAEYNAADRFEMNGNTLILKGQLPDMEYAFLGHLGQGGLSYYTNIDPDKIKRIVIRDGAKAGKTVYFMFSYLQNLTEISGFEHLDMSGMFAGTENLSVRDVAGIDTGNVEDMSGMFNYLPALTSLDVKSFDTSKVKDMSDMFAYCEKRTELDVTGFVTADVRDMAGMFAGCAALKSLSLQSFDKSQVISMFAMFSDCPVLETIDMSGCDTSRTMHMQYVFAECPALKTITVSDKWTTAAAEAAMLSTETDMFRGCTSLKGGAGTVYDSAHTGLDYARIDGGTSAPGHLTAAKVPVTSVTLNKTTASLKVGGTVTLKATVKPDNATDKTVTWPSDKPAVATVENGVVKAVAIGTAKITASTSNGKSAVCTVTVTAAPPAKPTVIIKTAFGGRTVQLNCDDKDAEIYYQFGSSNIT